MAVQTKREELKDKVIQYFVDYLEKSDGYPIKNMLELIDKYTAEKVLEGKIEEAHAADNILRLKSPLPFSGNYHATMGAYLRDRDEILQAELAQLKEKHD